MLGYLAGVLVGVQGVRARVAVVGGCVAFVRRCADVVHGRVDVVGVGVGVGVGLDVDAVRLVDGQRGAVRGAALAVHPARVAARVVLLLPDRDAVLDLVDDVAARREGLGAVRCADADPDGDLAERQRADTVHAARAAHAEAGDRLRHDPLALLDRELGVRLVLERAHGAPVVVVAHPALEAREAAGGRVGQRGNERAGRERHVAELEGAHLSHPRPAE